jgi:hypothetical protein
MGYTTRVRGELAIVPPLPYAELKKNKWYYADSRPNFYELRINTVTEVTETDEGRSEKITGVSFSYAEGAEPFKAYYTERNVQDMADSLPEGTRLTGYLEMMGEDGQQSRIVVRDGIAETVVPKIVWPDDE